MAGKLISPPGLNMLHMSSSTKMFGRIWNQPEFRVQDTKNFLHFLGDKNYFDTGQRGRKRFVFDRSEPINQ